MLLKLVTENGERGTGNGERGTGNGERGTGNGEREPGTGVWERVYSGNRPKNSTWRTKEKKREQFGEMRGSVTVVNVSFYRLCHLIMAQYVLVREESDWYWDKQSMKWRLG